MKDSSIVRASILWHFLTHPTMGFYHHTVVRVLQDQGMPMKGTAQKELATLHNAGLLRREEVGKIYRYYLADELRDLMLALKSADSALIFQFLGNTGKIQDALIKDTEYHIVEVK